MLCPLVPSVLWPLPALRMLPMLPSLPTLFLSPAAWGRRGGCQRRPGIGADTGHRGPRQEPVCQHSDASKNQPLTRSLRLQTMHQSLPPPGMHGTDRVTWAGKGTQGRGLAEDMGREGAALWAPLNSLSLSSGCFPTGRWKESLPPCPPARAGLGTGEGPQPLSLPSCTPDLSCQGPGPSGLG